NIGKINIGLKDMMNRHDDVYSVYLYRETLADEEMRSENDVQIMIPKPLYIGKLKIKDGRGEGAYTFDWNNVRESGKPITAWSGIAIKRLNMGEGRYDHDMFCSSWTDSIVDYSYMLEEEKDDTHKSKDINSGKEYEKADEPESVEVKQGDGVKIEISEQDKSEQEVSAAQNSLADVETPYANPIEEMLDTYERLPLLPECGHEGNQIIESVKITPNDIGLLDMNNWRLGVNSFLTHGFYNYKYLMLGRIVFQDNQSAGSYVLGVPGVYSAKEKYLAGIFGFDRFIPGKETEIKTGSFGYWIVNITG
ncbi:MAG: DUF6128 domain-containing protein, partial [Coprococcus sp.]